MFMQKLLKKGLAVLMFMYVMAALPSWADICFLPTGACEQSAAGRRAKPKTCSEYLQEGSYYAGKQEGMDCVPANISGCSLYVCTGLSCASRGYTIPDSQKNTYYADSGAWRCDSCRQDMSTYWKCTAAPCGSPYVTADKCSSQQTLVVSDATHRSGNNACGICKDNSSLSCKAPLTSAIPAGCVLCDREEHTGEGGIDCYRCREMVGAYYTEAVYNAKYDDSCYTRKEKQAANGTFCYKAIERTCPNHQYKRIETVNGKDLCKCREYEYALEIVPSKIKFSAAGGEQTVAVVSERRGNEVEPWEFNIHSTSGNCSVKKSGNSLNISCPPNTKEEATDSSFTLAQTQEDGETNKQVFEISVSGDKCSVGLLRCSGSDYTAVKNGKFSDAGQVCYDCNKNDVNDNNNNSNNSGSDKSSARARAMQWFVEKISNLWK